MIRIFAHSLLLLVAFVLFNLGFDWIEIGVGLNPWIAFPISALLTAFVGYTTIKGIQEEYNTIQEQLEADRKQFYDKHFSNNMK
jgi:hypothetical protein